MKRINCKTKVEKENSLCSCCGYDAKNITIKTSGQRVEQVKKSFEKLIEVGQSAIRIIIAILLMTIGLLFFCIGIEITISDALKSKDYVETTSNISRYEYSRLGGYVGIYEYTVNGNEYEIEFSEVKENQRDLPNTLIVKYDENNPSKSIIKSNNWFIFGLRGLPYIILSLFLIFFRKINKKFNSINLKFKL